MGNQASQNSMQQLKELKSYEQVSRTSDGVIYRKRIMSSEQQTPEYFILKEHNYHNQESYEQAFKRYKQSLAMSQQQQSNTLSIKEVVKEQIQHFCSNTFKIYALYEYPQLTLRDEIQVRAKENKFFEECQIVAILQTCVLALEEIRAVICFGSNVIFISPDGVIKVIHNDLVDENYRHVVTPRMYYAPQKLTNFMSESTSQISLKKETIFSMGMTLLQACKLEPVNDVYDYNSQTFNQQRLGGYIDSLSERYSTELIDLLSNMLEINPNRRISILQVQRALNKFDEITDGQNLNQQEETQREKQELQNKCEKFFTHDGNTLPRIKESNESNEEPSIPNILSHQNSSRLSLVKNYNSKGTANTSEDFYQNIEKSMEGYKITCNLANNSNNKPNNMTAHFPQPMVQPVPKSVNDHIFTDPKLLQMIRKDLEEINKSRTSRIMCSDQQINNSWVNNSQNVIENSATNRYSKTPYDNQRVDSSAFNESSYDRYMNDNRSFTELTTLQNCPQVQSLAASVAFDSMSGQKKGFVYEESDVKRHPEDRIEGEQKMKVSIALSTKNFTSNKKNQTEAIQPSTVRFPLREVSNNLNQASSLSSVEDQIKAAMMKKKQANLIYLQEVYQDGVKYEGMSKDGFKQGYGKLLYNDGAYYQGYFHDDKINGKGTLYYKKNCPAYDGQWLDEQFNGYGQLYNEQPQQLDEQFPYHNWNFLENYWVKYQGEFLNDNKHGKGKIYLTTEEYIQGEFQEDMLNGWGKFFKADGDCIEGRWENNILVELKNQ